MHKKILEAREKRWNKRIELIKNYNSPLLTLTLNIPGNEKNNKILNKTFKEIEDNLKKYLKKNELNIIYDENDNTYDGPVSYIVINNISAVELKKITTIFENKFTLGRIADIDIMNEKYENISRTELGFDARKCYLCSNNAHFCTVNRTHEKDEIIKEIYNIIENYFKVTYD